MTTPTTPHLTYTSADGIAARVSFDRYDACQHERVRWAWELIDAGTGATLARGDDLTTVGEPNYAEALRALSSFLGAWAEAIQYEHRTHATEPAENADLFPRELIASADAGAWELFAHELADALEQDR